MAGNGRDSLPRSDVVLGMLEISEWATIGVSCTALGYMLTRLVRLRSSNLLSHHEDGQESSPKQFCEFANHFKGIKKGLDEHSELVVITCIDLVEKPHEIGRDHDVT